MLLSAASSPAMTLVTPRLPWRMRFSKNFSGVTSAARPVTSDTDLGRKAPATSLMKLIAVPVVVLTPRCSDAVPESCLAAVSATDSALPCPLSRCGELAEPEDHVRGVEPLERFTGEVPPPSPPVRMRPSETDPDELVGLLMSPNRRSVEQSSTARRPGQAARTTTAEAISATAKQASARAPRDRGSPQRDAIVRDDAPTVARAHRRGRSRVRPAKTDPRDESRPAHRAVRNGMAGSPTLRRATTLSRTTWGRDTAGPRCRSARRPYTPDNPHASIGP